MDCVELSLVLLMFLLLTTFISAGVQSQHTIPRNDVDVQLAAQSPQKLLMDVQPKLPIIMPLVWDSYEAAYLVKLLIGNQLQELVVDTGSSQLSVKGSGCEWTMCDGVSDCTQTKCPCGFNTDGSQRTDCDAQHHYQGNTGILLKPGEKGAGTLTKMTYGSQIDSIQHWWDTIAMPGGSVTCSELQNSPSRIQLDAVGAINPLFKSHIVVHRVFHIDGTSSSNLLGMSRPNGGSREIGKFSVLDHLFAQSGNKTWGMVCYNNGGWLSLGAIPCFTNVNYIPLVQPKQLSRFVTSFYIVEIQSFAFGESTENLVEVARPPKYALLDTGTTHTYGPIVLGESMSAAGYNERKHVVCITLGSKTQQLTMTYTPSDLIDSVFGGSVLNITRASTFEDYETIFPNNDVILFGAVMMRNRYFEYDLQNNRLGIEQL